jgi:phosphoribosylglycinamide formyltransferase 2
LEKTGASAVLLAMENGTYPEFNGINEVMADKLADVKIFGKPTTRPYRRMGVVLAYDDVSKNVEEVKQRAIELSKKITIKTKPA